MVDLKHALQKDGFAVIPEVLDACALDTLRTACARRVADADADHLARNRTTGSMLGVEADVAFAELIGWPPTLAFLRGLEFGEVAWSSGYVINKPAGAPRLFWHQDWLWWTHPISAAVVPHQLFAMYYVTDTDRGNGCLRVVPGSHRQRLPAHDRLAVAHSSAALAGTDADHPMFGDVEGEIDVPVRAGDLLIGDSRLLHAAHANGSAFDRPLVTLWYHPAFDALPSPLQGYLGDNYGNRLAGWPATARNRVGCRLPYRTDEAQPWPICREPHQLA